MPPNPAVERKAFLLRIDAALWEAVRRWAEDDLRSVNGQIEFLLREAAARRGRDAGARLTDRGGGASGGPGSGRSPGPR